MESQSPPLNRKVRALLAYLAVESDRPHRRETLACLLWPERPEGSARRNLSQALFNLRRVIGDHDATPPFLLITRQTLQFNRSSDYRLDVTTFTESLAACERHRHPRLEACEPCMERLQQAVALYQGAFLTGFSPGDSLAFEEWFVREGERLHRLAMEALRHLADYHQARGEYKLALQYAQRWVELDPWREPAHRQLMRLLASSGQRGAALAQYETCRRLLMEELGAEPGGRTIQLYEQIKVGEISPPPSCSPFIRQEALSPFVVGPPITAPRQFFGRERELRRIFGLWRRFPLQNVAVIGPKRSGKTSLLHYVKNITGARPVELRSGQRTDWLPQPERYQWVFVDFQDARMSKQDRLLRYLLTSLSIPATDPCSLDVFMDVVSQYLQRPTVVLMDEIGAGLASPELDEPFWWGLRSLASHCTDGNLAYVLTSHGPPAQLAQDHGKPSPFFNIFHTLELGPFTDTEARELIASSPRPFAPADVAWILNHSGRWPCLLQILCQTRLTALEEGRTDDAWREEGLRQIALFRYLLVQ